MSEDKHPILVSQCFPPMCSACESGRGLWDSDGDRLNYCGNCGARLDWNTVVDADADDAEREPRDGELECGADDKLALALQHARELSRTLAAVRAGRARAIEEAQRSVAGNASLLRVALKLCIREMCKYCLEAEYARNKAPTICAEGCETLRIANEALDDSPRNCDLYADERAAWKAYNAIPERHGLPPY